MANLEVEFCGVKFKNPIVLASGILGVTGASLKRVVDEGGAGGVTSKSIWLDGHTGHPNPTIISTEHWMLNAVGVPDAGIAKAREELGWYLEECDAPLIANIIAHQKSDFGKLTEEIAKINPHIIEVNISCPNVEDEFGRPFACSLEDAADVTREVKAHVKDIPVIVKLSPNVENIVTIAKGVEDAGADGITAINTVGPGLSIDIETGQPHLHNKVGGLSGPGIKPLAIRLVHEITKNVSIPVVGTGGVLNGEDAIEMMMAGATLVGVGTAVYYREENVFGKIVNEMNTWCDEHSVANVSDIIGRTAKVLGATNN